MLHAFVLSPDELLMFTLISLFNELIYMCEVHAGTTASAFKHYADCCLAYDNRII